MGGSRKPAVPSSGSTACAIVYAYHLDIRCGDRYRPRHVSPEPCEQTSVWYRVALSLGTLIWAILIPTSFALPAWATWASRMFSGYAPLSWVIAGFCGLLVYTACVALYGFGRHRTVMSRYDEKFLRETGGVDPQSKVFEGKRIFLNDLILPSNPTVNGKTFVDCEIVGPANVYPCLSGCNPHPLYVGVPSYGRQGCQSGN